jgi:hypothetical protein
MHVTFTRAGLVSVAALALALAPTVAFAQQPPPAAPAGPPPAGQPAPGAPAAPPADQTTPAPAEQPPEPLIWRGTTFTWTTAATTTMLGVGRDNIGGEEDYFGMDWVLAPQLYLLDLPDDKILVFAEGGVSLEITDSGTTTTKKEPQFRDTTVGVGYNRNIYTTEDKEWSTKGGARARAIFPSSPTSRLQGRYMVSTLGITLSQQIRLLGTKADGLNNLLVTAGFTWSHLFARSYTPTNPDLERERQSASGQNILSDQLTYSSMDMDRIIPSVTFILPLYKDLSLTTAFRLIGRFRHDFEGTGCDVVVMGECTQAQRMDDRVNYLTNSTFDVALSQPIYDVVSLNIGYNNETLTLGEDGKNRNVFYSPGAQFYVDLVANIDEIYSKASGHGTFELPPGPRSSVTAAANENGMPSF